MVRIEGLRKSFGSLEVLRDINLDVMPGQVVTIIGPFGLGQIDASALHQPARNARCRPCMVPRRGHSLQTM